MLAAAYPVVGSVAALCARGRDPAGRGWGFTSRGLVRRLPAGFGAFRVDRHLAGALERRT